jgi:hypothetical protein
MGLNATARRRWFGGIILFAALLMLVCGQTVLKSSLQRLSFLTYWLVCFILTGLAAIIALRDLREVHQQTREQQKDLLDTTLRQIEKEVRNKKPKNPSRN